MTEDPYEVDASRSRSRARAAPAAVESGDAPGKISFEVIKPRAKSRAKSRDTRAMAAEIALALVSKVEGTSP